MQRQIFMTTMTVKRECIDDNSWQIDCAVVVGDSYGSNVDTVDNARSLGIYDQYGNSDDSDIDNDGANVDDVGNFVDYHQRCWLTLMLNIIDDADVDDDDVGNLVDYHQR